MIRYFTAIQRVIFLSLFISWLHISCQQASAQINENGIPVFGAQIFIEPGQEPEEIDTWFRLLKENGMTLCRIRMFESYMKNEDETWDFTLFDHAFKAADKYGIKVLATIFPYTEKTDIGGFKFPHSEQHLQSISEFIRQLVSHYKQFDSLYGWVLINEPGSGSLPKNDFVRQKFQEWLKKNPPKDFTDKGFPVLMDLTEQRFLMDLNTWYINWLADEVRKYDAENHLHVNSHAIFNLTAEYNFPAWRQFLNSLGGSAHPSWHFGYFDRNQFALAMSANSEIIRSGAGNLPWLMTEIQGGNNIYSGTAPFCPTAEEITQWLWTIIGTESKGSIFWSLNPRSSGIEAGEWALLTFQNKSSDRLIAAKNVAAAIQQNAALFRKAKLVDYGINLLYIRESMWAENVIATPSKQNYEGREKGAVMKSVLGYFEAFSELGLNCNLKEFREFDFEKESYFGQIIVLSNQLAVPTHYVSDLEAFVAKGGMLIVDGLTAYFDENLHNTMKTGFPFQKLFGGNISEFKLIENIFDFPIGTQKIPAHLWRGIIENDSGRPVAGNGNEIYAVYNAYGNGKVIWVPSLLGLGSRIVKDYKPLSLWLNDEIQQVIKPPFRFERPVPGVFMKTMQSGSSYITVMINKSGMEQTVFLISENNALTPRLIFTNDKRNDPLSFWVVINDEETLVIEWE